MTRATRAPWLAAAALATCACSRSEPAKKPEPTATPATLSGAAVRNAGQQQASPAASDAKDAAIQTASSDPKRDTERQGDAGGREAEEMATRTRQLPDAPRANEVSQRDEPPTADARPHVATDTERASGSVQARFRPRPGRRFDGRAELRSDEDRTVLQLTVRHASEHVERVRFYEAGSCAEFGVGAGKFSSMNRGESTLHPIGELRLEDGQATAEYTLPPTRSEGASPRGRAIVAYAPIEAHNDEASEPIACAELPRT